MEIINKSLNQGMFVFAQTGHPAKRPWFSGVHARNLPWYLTAGIILSAALLTAAIMDLKNKIF